MVSKLGSSRFSSCVFDLSCQGELHPIRQLLVTPMIKAPLFHHLRYLAGLVLAGGPKALKLGGATEGSSTLAA